MNSNLIQKLRNPDYRKAFVASQINIGIPFQIRALLKSRPGWTQGTLANRTGMLQPRISGLMTPGKVRPNIETLRRIAEAFDCGLMVRFVPFSDLARWSEDFDPESFSVPSFENDTGFIEHKPEAATAGKALQQLAHGSLPPVDPLKHRWLGQQAHVTSPQTLKGLATMTVPTTQAGANSYNGLRLVPPPPKPIKANAPPSVDGRDIENIEVSIVFESEDAA